MEKAEIKAFYSGVALLGLLMNARTNIVTEADMDDAATKAVRIGDLMAKKVLK